MAIRQLSVFIENKKGKLSDAVKTISEAGINMRAMSIGDSDDFGILRLIVSDTAKAYSLLSEDMIVKVTDVIAVKMNDKQGALYTVLRVLEKADINVEYTYAFTARELGAYVVFRVNDVEAAEKGIAYRPLDLLPGRFSLGGHIPGKDQDRVIDARGDLQILERGLVLQVFRVLKLDLLPKLLRRLPVIAGAEQLPNAFFCVSRIDLMFAAVDRQILFSHNAVPLFPRKHRDPGL